MKTKLLFIFLVAFVPGLLAQTGPSRNRITIVTGQEGARVSNEILQPDQSQSFSAGSLQSKTSSGVEKYEQSVKKLAKRVEQRAAMKGLHEKLVRVEHLQLTRNGLDLRTSERAKLFGKPTKFLNAQGLSEASHSPAPGKFRTRYSVKREVSNVLIGGKIRDTIEVGQTAPLTFNFAPNMLSAIVHVYLDVDKNGIVSDGDLETVDFLAFDNDDNDEAFAAGMYKISLGTQLGLNSVVATLVFQVNDFQSVSTAALTIRQKPSPSVLLGTIVPARPYVACEISGSEREYIVFTDSAGAFSLLFDRQQETRLDVRLLDFTGATNGFVPPRDTVVMPTGDTTRIQLTYSDATSFIEGYAKDQDGAVVRDAFVKASCPAFEVMTKTDSTGNYRLGVGSGVVYLSSRTPSTTEYLGSSSVNIDVPLNTVVKRDLRFLKSNSTISGAVKFGVNSVGGVPLFASSDTLYNFVLTAAGGGYSLPVFQRPTSGTYAVECDVPSGYFVNGPLIGISPGATNINFQIQRVTGGLQGTVTDFNTGKPISGAYVTASGMDYKSAISNDSGYFRLSLLSGSYNLYIDAATYYEYTEYNILVAGDMITRNVALHCSGSFSGLVKNTVGEPRPSASVVAYDSAMGWSVGWASADSKGSYKVSGLQTGTYRAFASADGYVGQWYNGVSVADSAKSIHVIEGYDTPGIHFVLALGGSLSGKVVDKAGDPISGVWVTANDLAAVIVSGSTTNASGEYTVSGLVTGDYLVEAYSEFYVSQWYNRVDTPNKATRVHVTINQNTPGINFTLSRGASISGTVKNKSNVGISNSTVTVFDSLFSSIAFQYADNAGVYSVPRLPIGKRLYVVASASGYSTRWYVNATTSDLATAIVLQDEEKREHIDFTLSVAGSISGRILDDANNPLAFSNVFVLDSMGGNPGYGYADAQGNYVVSNLPNGKYFVRASSGGYVDQWFDHKSSWGSADAVIVREEVTTPNVDFNLHNVSRDSVVIKIELADIPDTLTFSRSFLGDNYTDYWWGVCFDADGNVSTGTNGCEIEIALIHSKFPGEAQFQSNMIDATSHVVLQWSGNYGTWIDGNFPVQIDRLNKKTVVMTVPMSWPEIAGFGGTTTCYAHTYHKFSATGTASDITISRAGMGSVADPKGDISYSFADIVAASWEIKTAGDVRKAGALLISFNLYQNYPNPFNPSTVIAFDVPRHSFVTLRVYNVLGQEVASLVDELRSAGRYQERWNAATMPSGIYFYSLTTEAGKEVRKMLLIK